MSCNPKEPQILETEYLISIHLSIYTPVVFLDIWLDNSVFQWCSFIRTLSFSSFTYILLWLMCHATYWNTIPQLLNAVCTVWREHSTLLRLCQYVFPHVKPPWQPPSRFHLLLQISGMHCLIICHPFQLFLLLEELSNITYSCWITLTVVQNLLWVQCFILRDTAPTSAIAKPRNTMPPI